MKQYSVLFSVCFLALCFTSCNSKAKRAKIYHDQLLQSVQRVIDHSLDYSDGIQSYEKNKALKAHTDYLTLVNKTLDQVQANENFGEDTVLQHHAVELLMFYKNALEQDFQPLLTSVSSEIFSEEERLATDSIYAKMTMMENQYWARFDWAEKKFYKENEISTAE